MRFGHSDVCLEHDPGPRHPESPDRLRAIRRRITREHATSFTDAEDAKRRTVEAIHDADYIAELEQFCANGGGEWDPDTTAVEATWEAAWRSAGLAVWAARRALAGDDGRDTPFAIGRPPGHHAEPDDAMGFCFLNNVAIAATDALRETAAERVAIFDWDVHHGNGTQTAFLDRGDVFYASIHEEGLYPGTGDLEERGTGPGEGATMNVPLPSGASDGAYHLAMSEAIRPALERFDPDLLLVSAGFDPHRHDPISRIRLSTDGFGRLTEQVRGVADDVGAALGFVLEGGYGLDTLSDGVAMVNQVFDGYEPVALTEEPDSAVRDRISAVRDVHAL
jgi:acetoin utilization deacetylase AcuC-like enzyme